MILDNGDDLHSWASDLFPITRSLTGNGVRETLSYLQQILPGLEMHEIPTGTPVMDWTVPDEWNIADAYIAAENGDRIVDFRRNNLHVVGYSEPIDALIGREELEQHLHSIPEQPDAIPYITSYYSRTWGFCLTEKQRSGLGPGPFRVRIDSTLAPGSLTYADLVIPGDSDEEVLVSTYVCHPSMANNELSGPVVATALARWLLGMPKRRFTYRFVFIPETIGSICYLAQHIDHLRAKVIAGWVLTCIGDERSYSYLPSRLGGTLADRVTLATLDESGLDYVAYSFLDRGSDERQWCAPGVDLPVVSVMRSKYGEYPEYHTSLDDLSLVTPKGLQGGFDIMRKCIELLEDNRNWTVTVLGEPQLGRRGLYPTTSTRATTAKVYDMMNVIAYSDGNHDIVDLARVTGITTSQVLAIVTTLADQGLLVEQDHFNE